MSKHLNTRERLKALREEAGLTIRDVAAALGKQPSTYQHYEDRYKKQYLPLDLAQSLALIFFEHGIEPDRVLHLAGYNRDLDQSGDEAAEIGAKPSVLGSDGKLDSSRRASPPPGMATKAARNTFTIGFEDDLIVINARVDHERLGNVIKRLKALYENS
mmetsp:Transcript_3345/g.5773  ORF Transcript_3345/g.5773 Transcript_3345/m.5773 type:complete len:159 (+) Transcript_3345:1649-2125(+)